MIYCVEDDSSIRDLMVYALRAAGFPPLAALMVRNFGRPCIGKPRS